MRIAARALRATTDGRTAYAAGDPVTLYLSDARYVTRPDDDVPHQPHRTGVIDSANVSIRAWETIGGGAGFPRVLGRGGGIEGSLSVAWSEEMWWWDDVVFDGAGVEIREVRIRQLPDGTTTQDLWEDSAVLRTGKIQGRPRRTDDAVQWALVDTIEARLGQDLATGTFRGLGPCYELDGVADFGAIPHDAAWAPASTEYTLEMWFARLGTPAALSAVLQKGTLNGTARFSLLLTVSNTLTWRVVTTTAAYDAAGTTALDAGRGYWVTMTRTAGAIRLYLDGVLEAENATIAGSPATNTDALWVGRTNTGGGRYVAGRNAHLRLWHRAFAAAEVVAYANRQLTTEERADADLRLDVPFEDGYLGWGTERVAGFDCVLSGGEWAVTGEGAPDMRGVPRPLVIGERHAIEPVHLGTVASGAYYAASWRSILDWVYVYVDAIGLVKDLSVVVTLDADITTNTISVPALEGLLGFVPDQQITIAGSTKNDGTWTVQAVLSARRLRILETLAGSESTPGVTIASVDPAWRIDPYRPEIIRITAPPAGALRAFVRGDNAGAGGYASSVAEALELLATDLSDIGAIALDLGDASGRLCGLWVPARRPEGADASPRLAVGAAMAAVAACAHATTWADGAGARATRIDPDATTWVSLGVWARGSIDHIEEIPQDAPPSQIQVGYSKADATLDDAGVAALGWSYLADFARREYRIHTEPVPDAALWPSARPSPLIPSELTGEIGATGLAEDAAAFASGRLWRIVLRGTAGRQLEPGQVWTYYYGTPGLPTWRSSGWESGRDAIAVGVEIVADEGKTEVVVWTP